MRLSSKFLTALLLSCLLLAIPSFATSGTDFSNMGRHTFGNDGWPFSLWFHSIAVTGFNGGGLTTPGTSERLVSRRVP